MRLSDEQLLHYSRHILLPQMDSEGQEVLLSSHVAIVGLGGLGAAAALYLTAAGVGQLTLIDHDRVESSNLQRQIIHNLESIGLSKVDSAQQRLSTLNSDVTLVALNTKVTQENHAALFEGVDLIVDCSDNFTTRFLLNEVALQRKIPLVSGAAIRMEAQITVFDSRWSESPCYRCLYPNVEEQLLSCSESGVLAPLVGVIGSMQALEAIKVLVGIGSSLVGKLQLYDASEAQWRTLTLQRDPSCPACQIER